MRPFWKVVRLVMASDEMYRLCAVVDAAARLPPSDETLSFLCEAYEEAPYSFARIRAASQEVARAAGFSRERPVQ